MDKISSKYIKRLLNSNKNLINKNILNFLRLLRKLVKWRENFNHKFQKIHILKVLKVVLTIMRYIINKKTI